MKKSTTRITLIFIIIIVAIVGYYAYLSNQKQKVKEDQTLSVVQTVLSRDLTYAYPTSPKEVIKYYNDITKCFYNEECSEDELKELAEKIRGLYDDDLKAANAFDTYYENLKSEVALYKEKKRRITNTSVAASTSVDFYSVDGFDFARIQCGYTFMENGKSIPTNIVYLLRKDENKNWKIFGWDLAQNLRIGENE